MKLHEAIRLAGEMAGQSLSDVAVMGMTKALAGHSPEDVAHSLRRCAAECRSLRLADILERLPRAHPGPEEAWAIASAAYDEADTVVWTDPISRAFGLVRDMDDRVAARMAFREAYTRLVAPLRSTPAVWEPSPGHDPARRGPAIALAIEQGRLPPSYQPPALPENTRRDEGPPLPLAELLRGTPLGEDDDE